MHARSRLRVMTYNIHVGVGMDKQLNLQRIADVVKLEHPDLVGLQEVDRGVKRTEGIDEIAELGRLTGMEYAFAHNLDYQGGQYGVAILSRFPILKVDHRKYANKHEIEYNLNLLSKMNLKYSEIPEAKIYVEKEDEDTVDKLLLGKGITKDDKLIIIQSWVKRSLKRVEYYSDFEDCVKPLY